MRYELDPAHFLTESGLLWQAVTKVKLDLLTDIKMLLTVEKVIRCEIRHTIYQYVKTNNKYMKDYVKIGTDIYFLFVLKKNLQK